MKKSIALSVLLCGLATLGHAAETLPARATPRPRPRLDPALTGATPIPAREEPNAAPARVMEKFIVLEDQDQDIPHLGPGDVANPRKKFTLIGGGRVFVDDSGAARIEGGLWPSVDEADTADELRAEIAGQPVVQRVKLDALRVSW